MASGARKRVIVVQDGARLHYAIPLALDRAGILERMYTDWYASPGSACRAASRAMALVNPKLGRRMQDRYLPELDAAKVRSNWRLTLRAMKTRKSFATARAYHDWYSHEVAQWILARGLPQAEMMFGFVRNIHPDLLRAARDRRFKTIGDQFIAPYAEELREELRQVERFPGWSAVPPPRPEDSCELMERASWELLDHVTCASGYVRDGLVRQGVSPDRISVIPYPVDAGRFPPANRQGRKGPLTVGFVGVVGLRKGTPYFFQVARKINGANVRFVMVGNVQLTDRGTGERGAVELAGRVARSEIPGWLEKFDVFLFPSTCEGSAGAVIEAMCTGLPVICSPNSGTIIRDGVEGFVRAYDDIDGMAACIDRLASDPELREQMGRQSLAAAGGLTPARYGTQLAGLIEGLMEQPRRA